MDSENLRDSVVSLYSNKETHFRYHGKNLTFSLSHALFSSHGIDMGTQFLLQTLSKQDEYSHLPFFKAIGAGKKPQDRPGPGVKVLDLGCGIGIIGLALKTLNPSIEVTFQDRDALSLLFSAANCRKNSVAGKFVKGRAFQGLEPAQFNAIISNLPAKAGAPVLKHIISAMPYYLTQAGVCAVVVVQTLESLILDAIHMTQGEVLFQKRKGDYTVFHFSFEKLYTTQNNSKTGPLNRISETPVVDISLTPYIRGMFSFKIKSLSYLLETVYNIEGFDTLPYSVQAAVKIWNKDKLLPTTDISKNDLPKKGLSKKPLKRALLWNPKQGHLAVILALIYNIGDFILAGRDSLALEISSRNLGKLNIKIDTSTINTASLMNLPKLVARQSLDYLIIEIDSCPGIDINQEIEACLDIISNAGTILMCSNKGKLHYPPHFKKNLKKLEQKKHKGAWALKGIVSL